MVEDVVDFIEQYIDDITSVIMPDGVGFGEKKQTMQERVAEYAKLRGDPEAWARWIGERAGEISARAQQMLPPEQAASINAWDIAARLAIQYGLKMEKEYLRGQEKQVKRLDAMRVREDDA